MQIDFAKTYHSFQTGLYSRSNYTNAVSYKHPYEQVHLIPSDLWEAITGEHMIPELICEMRDATDLTPEIHRSEPPLYFSAKDHIGCRSLQQKLEEGNEHDRQFIFNSLLPYINDLAQDPNGNYVIQKLCEVANDEQQEKLLKAFIANPNLIEYPNGCRVIQKFLETTTTDRVDKIFETLHQNLFSLCFSQNGNHLVQRFVEKLPHRLEEIINSISSSTTKLVVDNCGCRVVQRMFDIYPISKLTPLVVQVLSIAESLAKDQYGNYVIQNILQKGSSQDVQDLLTSFKGHFYEFSVHKFASNVIEKCIRNATPEQRNEIFEEIIGREGYYEEERIKDLVGDQFGNYVIQRILEYGTAEQQEKIFDVVNQHFDELCLKNYSKHVIQRLKNLDFEFD